MSETTKDQIDAMLQSYERLEKMRLQEAEMSQAHLKLGIEMLKINTARNKIQQELVDELRRLRITGIQP